MTHLTQSPEIISLRQQDRATSSDQVSEGPAEWLPPKTLRLTLDLNIARQLKHMVIASAKREQIGWARARRRLSGGPSCVASSPFKGGTLFRLRDEHPIPVERWRAVAECLHSRPIKVEQRAKPKILVGRPAYPQCFQGALPVAATVAVEH